MYLRKNLISDPEQLHYLTDLPFLTVLWLQENPICQIPNYRSLVIRMLPQLKKLDERDITLEERQLSESFVSQTRSSCSISDDQKQTPLELNAHQDQGSEHHEHHENLENHGNHPLNRTPHLGHPLEQSELEYTKPKWLRNDSVNPLIFLTI